MPPENRLDNARPRLPTGAKKAFPATIAAEINQGLARNIEVEMTEYVGNNLK